MSHSPERILGCIYTICSIWSNFSFLHNSQLITLPTQSCLVLYSPCANLLHSLIMWLIVSSPSPHNWHTSMLQLLKINMMRGWYAVKSNKPHHLFFLIHQRQGETYMKMKKKFFLNYKTLEKINVSWAVFVSNKISLQSRSIFNSYISVQSAEAVECTDCISAEGWEPPRLQVSWIWH